MLLRQTVENLNVTTGLRFLVASLIVCTCDRLKEVSADKLRAVDPLPISQFLKASSPRRDSGLRRASGVKAEGRCEA